MKSNQNTPSNPCSGLGLQLPAIAELAHLLNRLAHGFHRKSAPARRAFRLKADVVSLLIELSVPEVHVVWHGDYLLLVSIARLRTVHVPFCKLSYAAQCRVIQAIGPAPESAQVA